MGVNSCGQLLIDQGNFFNTGLLNWDTTAKTANFTAVDGNGYFVNTTSAAVTVTLPAGSAGDFIGVSDYASTSNINAITISPNGTDKINGTNENYTITTSGIAVSLLYVDSTRGWKAVASNSAKELRPSFVTATGGTITRDGDYNIHTFTGPGTFTVTCAGSPLGSNSVDYLIVAGGAGTQGIAQAGGGGGAGGLLSSSSTVSKTAYSITVGAGGTGSTSEVDPNGSNSTALGLTATGGGAGGYGANSVNAKPGIPGGSGGGGGSSNVNSTSTGGTGTSGQGNNGGIGEGSTSTSGRSAGGGGGSGAAGGSSSSGSIGGDGGAGTSSSITGSAVTYAGGGGGGGQTVGGAGGSGGGGAGASGNGGAGVNGTANTGGGAGSDYNDSANTNPTNGGSGIVIIRYKFQ